MGLYLISPYLNEKFLRLGYSNHINNVLWRLELWRMATKAALRFYPLFGFPLGTSIDFAAFELYDFNLNLDLHNSHLSFLFRMGIVGFLLYLSILIFYLSTLIKSYRRSLDPRLAAYVAGFLSLFLLTAFNVMLEGPFCGSVFWIVVGWGMASAADMKYEKKDTR